jgi:hypothetical protein
MSANQEGSPQSDSNYVQDLDEEQSKSDKTILVPVVTNASATLIYLRHELDDECFDRISRLHQSRVPVNYKCLLISVTVVQHILDLGNEVLQNMGIEQRIDDVSVFFR